MSNPILICQFRSPDGTLGTSELSLPPGSMITTDAQGNPTVSPIPVVPAQRVGDIALPSPNIVGATGTVAFSSPMPSADYVLDLEYNGFAGLLKVTAKTQAGFAYSILAVLGGVPSYHAMQKV